MTRAGDRLDCFARMTRAEGRLTFTLILLADRGDVPFLDRNAPNIDKQKSFFHRIPFAKSTIFTLRSPSPRKEIFSRRRRLRAKQQHTFIPLPSRGTTDFDASVFYKNLITVAVPNFSFTYLTKQPGAAAVIFFRKKFPLFLFGFQYGFFDSHNRTNAEHLAPETTDRGNGSFAQVAAEAYHPHGFRSGSVRRIRIEGHMV